MLYECSEADRGDFPESKILLTDVTGELGGP